MFPTVSIIVPVYNVEQYLNRCLSSLVKQSYTNLEIILVDDGSTDSSGRLCDEWKEKDQRIIVIHKKNGGLSSARNAGLDILTGDFVAFVDSDDYVDNHFVETLYINLVNTKSDISACSIQRFNENGEIEIFSLLDNKQADRTLFLNEFFPSSLCCWNKLYKKELFNSIRFPINKFYEDSYIYIDILYKANRVVTCDKFLYFYFYNPKSITTSTNPNVYIDAFNSRIHILNFINQNNLGLELFNNRFKDMTNMYWDSRTRLKELHSFKEVKLLKNQYKEISKKYNIFLTLGNKIRGHFPVAVNLLKPIIKKIIKYLRKFHSFAKKITKKILRISANLLFYFICVPRRNQIFFTHFFGSPFEGSIKSISNELLNLDKNVRLIVAVSDLEYKVPSIIKKVKYRSLKYYYYFYKSRIVISDVRNNKPLYKKKSQFFIQLWHGTFGGGKKVESDIVDLLTPHYLKSAINDAKNSNLMISGSKKQTMSFYKKFWYKGPVLECGRPEYDILYNKSEHKSIREQTLKKLNISNDKYILVFAPTFRNDYFPETYCIDFNLLLQAFKKKFGKEFVILFHMHKNASDASNLNVLFDNVNFIDATSIDIFDLEITADFGLGDYSCFNTEMSILGKPVFRFASDLNKYDGGRDFYLPFQEHPHPFAFNNKELIDAVQNFNEKDFAFKNQKYLEYLQMYENKKSSLEIAKFIIDIIKIKNKKNVFAKYKNKIAMFN